MNRSALLLTENLAVAASALCVCVCVCVCACHVRLLVLTLQCHQLWACFCLVFLLHEIMNVRRENFSSLILGAWELAALLMKHELEKTQKEEEKKQTCREKALASSRAPLQIKSIYAFAGFVCQLLSIVSNLICCLTLCCETHLSFLMGADCVACVFVFDSHINIIFSPVITGQPCAASSVLILHYYYSLGCAWSCLLHHVSQHFRVSMGTRQKTKKEFFYSRLVWCSTVTPFFFLFFFF